MTQNEISPDQEYHEAPDGSWVDATLGRALRLSTWMGRSPMWVVAGVLTFASLARDGIVVWNWFALSPGLLRLWGDPSSAFQSNALFNALGTAWESLGLDPAGGTWIMVQILLTVIVFATAAYLLLRRSAEKHSYLALAVFLSGGIAAVLWREIGRYDSLFILGVLLAVLCTRRLLIWMGIVVAATASPEQLLAASLLLLLLALLPIFQRWRRLALQMSAVAVSALVAIQVWFQMFGSGGATRFGTLVSHFLGENIQAASAYDTKQSFVQFTIEKSMVSLSAGPGLVWSYLGAATFLLVIFILRSGSWVQTAYLLIVVIAVPVVAGFTFGEDRTRDISLIMAPVILVLILEGVRMLVPLVERLPGEPSHWLNWLAVIITLIPLTYFYLYAEEPFRWMKELLVAINNGVAFPNDGSAR